MTLNKLDKNFYVHLAKINFIGRTKEPSAKIVSFGSLNANFIGKNFFSCFESFLKKSEEFTDFIT